MIDGRRPPPAVRAPVLVTHQHPPPRPGRTSSKRHPYVSAEPDHPRHRHIHRSGTDPQPRVRILDHGLVLHHQHHRTSQRHRRQRLEARIEHQRLAHPAHLPDPLRPRGEVAPLCSGRYSPNNAISVRHKGNGRRGEDEEEVIRRHPERAVGGGRQGDNGAETGTNTLYSNPIPTPGPTPGGPQRKNAPDPAPVTHTGPGAHGSRRGRPPNGGLRMGVPLLLKSLGEEGRHTCAPPLPPLRYRPPDGPFRSPTSHHCACGKRRGATELRATSPRAPRGFSPAPAPRTRRSAGPARSRGTAD